MYALSRQENKSKRDVIIEKTKCYSNIYDSNADSPQFENFDTVEILTGMHHRFVGLLIGYSYRIGGQFTIKYRDGRRKTVGRKYTNNKTIGYATVGFISGSKTTETNFFINHLSDDVENDILIFIHPIKMVLIEKNIVGFYEKVQQLSRELVNNMPPMGG